MSRRLLLYTKSHCPLCDEAAAILQRLAPEFGLSVKKVDIEAQPHLWQRYRYLIPVVALSPEAGPTELEEAEVLLYSPITESRVREALTQRLAAGDPSRGTL